MCTLLESRRERLTLCINKHVEPQSLTEEATDMQDCTVLFHPFLSSTALSQTVGLYPLQIYHTSLLHAVSMMKLLKQQELSYQPTHAVKLHQLYDCMIRPGELDYHCLEANNDSSSGRSQKNRALTRNNSALTM